MRKTMTLAAFLAIALAFSAQAEQPPFKPADQQITSALRSNLDMFFDLLALPNIPAVPADMRRNAEMLVKLLAKRGMTARLIENPAGRPAVYGELPKEGAHSLLFYIHFDGQPVLPEQWAQASPFQPVVKQKAADGKWREVPRETLLADPFDPELRIFARSASDDKGPILMFLTALDLLRAAHREPAFGIKLLLDSEEEIGSPSLAGEVSANQALFGADGMVIIDGPSHPSGRPTLVFGNRGVTQVTLTVYGPRSPLHSGHFGNYVPNPAFRLARLLASMKDEQGRVLVAGYYDGIVLSDAEKAILAATPDDEAALKKRAGIAKPEQVGASYQEALQYPSLNIRGMASAAIGEKAANILPAEAVAELDLRTTPERDGHQLYEAIRAHVQKQGYHLTDGPPSEADRASYDKLASLTLGPVEDAERIPMNAKIGAWAAGAVKAVTAQDPVLIRMMGGTVPTDALVNSLHQPFLLLPLVNADNNQHSYDENLRMGNVVSGTRTLLGILTTPFPR